MEGAGMSTTKTASDIIQAAAGPCRVCDETGKLELMKRPRAGSNPLYPNAFTVALQCAGCGSVNVGGVPWALCNELRKAGLRLREITAEQYERSQQRAKAASEQRADRMKRQWEADQARQSAEWFARYDAYLRTPAWMEKRTAVMRRDNGVCQACLAAPATQVHHLSYKHVFREPLFDLVSICDRCHDALHDKGG
jgi:5-methylcytosine-specific restriction endonuclease McrA